MIRRYAAIIFFCMAACCCTQVSSADRATVVLTGHFPLENEASEIEAHESEAGTPVEFCFFSENAADAACLATGRQVPVTEIVVSGQGELLYEGAERLRLYDGGCVIDGGTADGLFGTEEAEGQFLVLGGRSYVVCGTVKSSLRILLRAALKGEAEWGDGGRTDVADETELKSTFSDKETSFDHVVVRPCSGGDESAASDRLAYRIRRPRGGGDARGAAEAFLLRNSLKGEETDLSFVQAFLWDFFLLCVLGRVPGCFRGRKEKTGQDGKGLRFGKKRDRGIFLPVPLLLLLIILVCIAVRLAVIPSYAIPPRWSDFSFWGKLIDRERARLICILRNKPGAALSEDVMLLMRAVMLGSLGAIMGY